MKTNTFDQISEAVRLGECTHQQRMQEFKELIDETLLFRYELGLSPDAIEAFEKLSNALFHAAKFPVMGTKKHAE